MGSRGITALKFVGTVSLGLLTGLSFSLSAVTVPTLLTLPSARDAAKAFKSLASAAAGPLRTLSSLASSAFLIAFLLSPHTVRHPYLLYTSLLVLGSRAVTSNQASLYLFAASTLSGSSSGSTEASSTASPAAAPTKAKDLRRSTSNMEASYEVLGATSSSTAGSAYDSHSDGGRSEVDLHAAVDGTTGGVATLAGSANLAGINGEEVRAAVEVFLKKQIARTVLSGVAFAIAVVGIWGDGASAGVPVWHQSAAYRNY